MLMLSIFLFRDVITVNQYPGDEFDQSTFSFRLPQNFWIDFKTQQLVLFKVFSFIETKLDLHLISNGDLLPSSLTSDFSKYILFSTETSKLSLGFTSIFDKVIERTFASLEPLFDKLEGDSYLYIDFDVDSVGFFCTAETRKLGGYIDLSFQDYLENGIEEFYARPLIYQGSESIMRVLDMVLLKVHGILKRNGISVRRINKMILGGAYNIYFDTLELESFGNRKDLFNFNIVEKDSNYGILCENLL